MDVDKMTRESPNVGIITSPALTTGAIPLSNLIKILHPLSSSIYVITGAGEIELPGGASSNVYFLRVPYKRSSKAPDRIKQHVFMQLRILAKVVRLARKIDLWLFFFADALALSMLAARLLGKKAVLVFTGSVTVARAVSEGPLTGLTNILQRVSYTLANTIVIYSPGMIEEHGMQKYRHKVALGHEHFLDFSLTKVQKPLAERKKVVGYIGRLREIKGVLNFVQAIPMILPKAKDVTFLIGGDGELRGKLEEHLAQARLSDKVTFVGWIPHDEIPKYLNELKLLVLPSYTEGLPNIMLEAMACGVPVLATGVGAIPDVLKDGETGFIMGDNSPENIALNVIRALNAENLEQIAQNARTFVEREYTYEAAAERYKNILANLRVR